MTAPTFGLLTMMAHGGKVEMANTLDDFTSPASVWLASKSWSSSSSRHKSWWTCEWENDRTDQLVLCGIKLM